MAKSESHKRAQSQAAGKDGKQEVPISRGRRLDAKSASGKKATEVERGGTDASLKKAARRLRDSGASQKVLQVPQKDMDAATKAMRDIGVTGTVKNMGGTKRRSVH